ncbi:MAG: hypothetical protein AB7V55_04855 [Oscillospiraceae bacterium]
MKETSPVKGFRVAAGILYGVLAIYQMLFTRAVMQGSTLGNVPFVWLAALLFVPLAAVLSIWMFSSYQPLKAGAGRGVLVGTILAVVFELVTFTMQTTMVNYVVQQFLPNLSGNGMVLYVLVIIRLVLLILAVFFVINSSGKASASALPDGDIVDADRFKKKPAAPTLSPELDNPLTVKPADTQPPSAPQA